MLKVFLARNFYYFQSRGVSTDRHIQVAQQISVVEPGHRLLWDGQDGVGCFFPSSVPHTLSSDGILHTFLLNPAHVDARKLSRCHEVSCSFEPSKLHRQKLAALVFTASERSTIAECLNEFVSNLLDGEVPHEPMDERIAEALEYIDELETKRVAAGELAEQIALSESRFLHLFKEEMQMTVRKYLMWRRVIDAAIMVVAGEASITEAAHSTGFTDSAHFARVFKQIFGLTLTTVLDRDPPPVLVVGES